MDGSVITPYIVQWYLLAQSVRQLLVLLQQELCLTDVSAITEGMNDYELTKDKDLITDPISANLSRMRTLRGAYKGSGMSVSSGISISNNRSLVC